MTLKEIDEKLSTMKEYQRLADEAAAEAEAIKDSIKAELTARGVDQLNTDTFKVTWTTATSSRLNSEALKVANPELYKALTMPIYLDNDRGYTYGSITEEDICEEDAGEDN